MKVHTPAKRFVTVKAGDSLRLDPEKRDSFELFNRRSLHPIEVSTAAEAPRLRLRCQLPPRLEVFDDEAIRVLIFGQLNSDVEHGRDDLSCPWRLDTVVTLFGRHVV
ncbi:hypothetical protein PMIN02_008066 [Paraphaeosphaeria minitans]